MYAYRCLLILRAIDKVRPSLHASAGWCNQEETCEPALLSFQASFVQLLPLSSTLSLSLFVWVRQADVFRYLERFKPDFSCRKRLHRHPCGHPISTCGVKSQARASGCILEYARRLGIILELATGSCRFLLKHC